MTYFADQSGDSNAKMGKLGWLAVTITTIIAAAGIVWFRTHYEPTSRIVTTAPSPTTNRPITVVHTVSYSNAAVFVALQDNPGLLKASFVPDPTKHPEALQAAQTDGPVVSVTPFANALIAADRNPSLRIIAGSGLNGMSLVARDAKTAQDLRGKKVGTSRGDSLELFAVEYLKREGLNQADYQLVYFTDPFEAIESIKAGKVDAVTHVEPFATGLVAAQGMHRLTTSRDLWGDHPDAVILTTERVLTTYRAELKSLIGVLQASEKKIKADPKETATILAKNFYNMPADDLLRILDKQQPQIDIRKYLPFLRDRYDTLERLHYVDHPFNVKVFDWTLLD